MARSTEKGACRCGYKKFWKSVSSKVTCLRCHPPALKRFVAEYVDVMPPSPVHKIEVEVVNTVYDAVERAKTTGVDRESIDWMVGDHDQAGVALMRCQQRNKRLRMKRRKGQECWYFRR